MGMPMRIRKATEEDCSQIAELALMAGEGIPAYFWAQAAEPGENIFDIGARNAAKEDENFSYRNVQVAEIDGKVAGMMLAYRLPDKEDAEDLEEFPEFIRPLIELEQCVPGSYYINMLATYPKFRNQSVGTALMATVDQLATEAGCSRSSIEVFEQNEGALRLYQRLGYQIRERRKVIPHSSHPYEGDIVLLTRPVTPK
jgi:ribosomal protein S18 acetylase RimI-like enzyme